MRCDEWALASLTYEMLAGENRFWRPISSALKRHRRRGAGAAVAVLGRAGPAVDDVIFFALDPDREERYATVADFAEELERSWRSEARRARLPSSSVTPTMRGRNRDRATCSVCAAPRAHHAAAAHGGGACGGALGSGRSRSWRSRPAADQRIRQPAVLGLSRS
ncbi:MAG: hypothetical protein ACLTMP_03240 [Eggerthella lenta]